MQISLAFPVFQLRSNWAFQLYVSVFRRGAALKLIHVTLCSRPRSACSLPAKASNFYPHTLESAHADSQTSERTEWKEDRAFGRLVECIPYIAAREFAETDLPITMRGSSTHVCPTRIFTMREHKNVHRRTLAHTPTQTQWQFALVWQTSLPERDGTYRTRRRRGNVCSVQRMKRRAENGAFSVNKLKSNSIRQCEQTINRRITLRAQSQFYHFQLREFR